MTSIAVAIFATLGWVPFYDYQRLVNLHDHWLWLMIPLALAIAIVYKTLKLPTLDHLVREVVRLAATIVLFMALIGAVLWLIMALV
jgi:hypothetical protein